MATLVLTITIMAAVFLIWLALTNYIAEKKRIPVQPHDHIWEWCEGEGWVADHYRCIWDNCDEVSFRRKPPKAKGTR